MRRFIITVNGKSYDVGVREVAEDKAAPEAPAAPSSAPAPAQPAAPERAAETAAAPADALAVRAPMPGTVVRFETEPGRAVKKDEVLLILEAMKMENEITAPADGVVASLAAGKGDAVESGQPLVYLRTR